MKNLKYLAVVLLCLIAGNIHAQKNKPIDVIAYYMGDEKIIDDYDVNKLTHVIFSFLHLKDGELSVDTPKDSLAIKHLVGLKTINPNLKVMLSLGGWAGCEHCSDVFSSAEARKTFAESVNEVNTYFKTDGIDLDWEYPTIEGMPGHPYKLEDRANFSDLVKQIRIAIGPNNELSFAAGGFEKFLNESVDWMAVMPLVDRVNIMSYDLVNGYATVTGHQAPLYGDKKTQESANEAVDFLLNLGIPAEKLVIGGAFYTRIWENVENVNNGLFQSGKHIPGVNFKNYATTFTEANGWKYFWDKKSKAGYWYNAKDKKFATGDDIPSIIEKTAYAKKKKLGGIMFWELTLDTPQDGMLDAIYKEKVKK